MRSQWLCATLTSQQKITCAVPIAVNSSNSNSILNYLKDKG